MHKNAYLPAALMTLVAASLVLPVASVMSSQGYCSQPQGSVEFADCLTAEVSSAYLEQSAANRFHQTSRTLLEAKQQTESLLRAVAGRYFVNSSSLEFTSVTRRTCTTFGVEVENGSQTHELDEQNCLNAGIIATRPVPQVVIYACYASNDEPVVTTGISCRATNGLPPVFAAGHNSAASGGVASSPDPVTICVEANALVPSTQRVGGVTVGARGSNSLNFCISR